MQSKHELRTALLAQAGALDAAYCAQADAAILGHILSSPLYEQAAVIFSYVSMAGEIPTTSLICRALSDGKRVCAPAIFATGQMEARFITAESDLTPGAFGILTPKDTCAYCPPGIIDLAIIPCLSCDPAGTRLGRGAGYYDRYLKQILRNQTTRPRAHFLAVCREKLLSEQLPRSKSDVAMNALVTERGLLSLRP
jgi:5-formyltetrahydrofolate cyclo-ligase